MLILTLRSRRHQSKFTRYRCTQITGEITCGVEPDILSLLANNLTVRKTIYQPRVSFVELIRGLVRTDNNGWNMYFLALSHSKSLNRFRNVN